MPMTLRKRFPKYLTVVRSDGTRENDWQWGETFPGGDRHLVRVYKRVGQQLLVKSVNLFRLMEWNGLKWKGPNTALDPTGRFLSANILDSGVS